MDRSEQRAPRPTSAAASVIGEQQRINHLVGQMRIGQTKVINGTAVTVIDLATADRIDAQNQTPRGDWRAAGTDAAS